MDQRQEGVKGFDMTAGVKASKQFGSTRTCAEEGCTTTLSRYNPGSWCGAHENPRDKKNMAGDGRSSEVRDRSSDPKWRDVDSSLRTPKGRSYPKRGR